MGIPEIQEIGKIVAQAGGTTREVFVWYIAKDLFSDLLVAVVMGGALYGTYRLLKRLCDSSDDMNKIAGAAGFTTPLYKSEVNAICKIISEQKKSVESN
jgi:hypothetical protein